METAELCEKRDKAYTGGDRRRPMQEGEQTGGSEDGWKRTEMSGASPPQVFFVLSHPQCAYGK